MLRRFVFITTTIAQIGNRASMNDFSIKVRDDVPIPEKNTGPTPSLEIPFDDLDEKGKSIEIWMSDEEARSRIKAIRLRALRHGRRTRRKYTVRLTDTGIGIWRK